MLHLHHLQKNKDLLQLRFQIIRLIREWFWSQGFIEVETPLILRLPGQEPYLNPMKIKIKNEIGQEFDGYLHTSPEYAMKKMLAAGFDKIFSLGKVFRDRESFGGLHNPEFTMIEWYRTQTDMFALMQDVEQLWQFLLDKLEKREMRKEKRVVTKAFPISHFPFQKVHMRDLWREYAGVNLDDYLDLESMAKLCASHYSLPITHYPSYEDAFYKIFLNKIESKLTSPTIIHHYPAPMAALAKLSDKEPGYAERFEVYINGVELANAFTELTDADEQLRRLQAEQAQHRELGKDVYDIDLEFIAALRSMPPSAGIALGVDRLVQVLTGCQEIDDVIPLPMSKLYGRHYQH